MAKIFKFIGDGKETPEVINFMGKQRFIKGEPIEVSDEELLKKLIINQNFVEVSAKDFQRISRKKEQEVAEEVSENGN